jgi:nucleoside-diphosphate-sugar epimerase
MSPPRVFLTGHSRGLGKALTLCLLERGARVFGRDTLTNLHEQV